uniref:Uncharacterized protein n=1 Tax=Oryza brachyantha TaxID=4533 RepID=J3ND49_ORYBR
MEVTEKIPVRVKRIRFADSQNECEVMLQQTLANDGQYSSMSSGDDAQRKPKWRRYTSSYGNGEADNDRCDSV